MGRRQLLCALVGVGSAQAPIDRRVDPRPATIISGFVDCDDPIVQAAVSKRMASVLRGGQVWPAQDGYHHPSRR